MLFFKMNCRKFDSTLAHIEDDLENQWLRKQYPDIKTGNSSQTIKSQDIESLEVFKCVCIYSSVCWVERITRYDEIIFKKFF